MRFTYRVTPGMVQRATENNPSKTKPVSATPESATHESAMPESATPESTTPESATPESAAPVSAAAESTVPTLPTVAVKPSVHHRPAAGRPSKRGSASSAASSSDESTASSRRQQRQRSAKTAAYNAMEAMDESDRDEDLPLKRRRLSAKSPRWELEEDSPEPYTVYRRTRSTPRATLEDLEDRYNTKPERKRVYAACSDDDDLSDDETKRNTLANKKCTTNYNQIFNRLKSESENTSNRHKSGVNGRSRKKKSDQDVYEFNAQNEDNENSNSTAEEYDFVYDNLDHDDANNAEAEKESVTAGFHRTGEEGIAENGMVDCSDEMNDLEAELEQHIEMEVVTDTEDMDQHIEDSIEEVEVDAEDDAGAQAEAEAATADDMADEHDGSLEAETQSHTSLVIAEDDEDDGVVEEVIAAEEDGHELVVVEDPEENDVTYTVEVLNASTPSTDCSEKLSEEASRSSSGDSPKSKSPTAEEDEPEIVHEKVFRKKSKKSKHHHHHHHHKRKRHHSPSPVMLISSPEEAPMKLTLKLRPTPSISPGNSSSRKSPQLESPSRETKLIIGLSSSSRDANGDPARSPNYSSQKVYTVKKVSSPRVTSPASEDKKFFFSKVDLQKTPSPPAESALSTTQKTEALSPKIAPSAPGSEHQSTLPSASPKAASTYPRTPTPPKDDTSADKKLVRDEVKERLTQMRQVRHKSSPGSVTSTSAASPSETAATSNCVPDLKSVKTPSSLVISKVEAGETPPRPQEPSRKPALEILMLPPSPPPSAKPSDEPESPSRKVSRVLPSSSVGYSQIQKTPTKSETRQPSADCVLDLSGKSNRDVSPKTPSPVSRSTPSPLSKPKTPSPKLPSPKMPSPKMPSPKAPSPKASSPKALSPTVPRDIAVRSDLSMGPPPELGLMPNPAQLFTMQNLTNEAMIATMNRVAMSSVVGNNFAKFPLLSPFCGQTINPAVSSQQRRLMPNLNDLYASRRVGGFEMPAMSPSRPGPNQSVRHIPNPSALLHRQQSHLQQTQAKLMQETLNKQQGQLTEEQLKERYQQFQQNRAARAAFTYSRVSSPGSNRHRNTVPSSTPSVAITSIPSSSSGSMSISSTSPSHNNNNLVVKTAIRSRSIEKVAAGLLSVRSGAYAVEAQVGH